VNGAGENLNYNKTVTVSAGTSKTITGVSNNFNYDDTSCAGLAQKDLYFVATVAAESSGFNSFIGNAKGNLKAGTLNFNIPIVIEKGGKKSTIRLSGTIQVSCPNG